ncbi:MAG: response regulator [Armatimonadetes bacterium]|nr:response regulator [Armatimonadota bacterium]
MIRPASEHDPATVAMALDIVGSLIGRADDPASATHYITHYLRQWAGARLVVLVLWRPDAEPDAYDVVRCEPIRRAAVAAEPWFRAVAAQGHGLTGAALWTSEDATGRVPTLLADAGYASCMCVPLRLADKPFASLIALDVSPDPFLRAVMAAQQRVAPIVTVLLRQALLIEAQAQTIEQRQVAERAMRWELQVNQAWAAVARTLGEPSLSMDEVARVALESALAVTRSRHGGVVEQADDGTRHLRAATPQMRAACVCESPSEQCRLCLDGVPSPPVDLGGETVWVGRPAVAETPLSLGAAEALLAPVWLGADRVGHVAVTDGEEPYTDRHIDALVQIAELYGLAIQRHRGEVRRERLEERLLQAGKMEAVGRLAGGVAHDFNNLLTAITGFAEFVDESLDEDSELRADMGEILKAAERAASLTRQLLAFGRRQVTHQRVVDLNAVVTDIEPMVRRLIGEDVRLTVDLAPDAGHVWADRGQVDQVLMNLVANAKSAMPEGGQLTVMTRPAVVDAAQAQATPALSPGAYAQVTVSDTGVGMDAATQTRIFEPFFTTRGVGEGTGLGLATAFSIVSQHHGVIECDSAPGRGTTFRVLLPRIDGASGDEDAPVVPVGPLAGTETVMVVEDEEGLRALCWRALRRHGYTVLTADCAETALELVAQSELPIDLLVTDVVMPGLSGPELARTLAGRGHDFPVVFVSGYVRPSTDAVDLAGLATSFLQKPFSPTALVEAVRRLLDAGRAE